MTKKFKLLIISGLICTQPLEASAADRYAVIYAGSRESLSATGTSTLIAWSYIGDQQTGNIFYCGYTVSYTPKPTVSQTGGCSQFTTPPSTPGVFSFALGSTYVGTDVPGQHMVAWRINQEKGIVSFCWDHSNFAPAPEIGCTDFQFTQ